jgi:hypothetical protein
MIKLPINSRVNALAKALDKVIADYKPPGRLVGAPDDNPKLSEADLIEIKKKGDVVVAPDVFTYFLEHYDQKAVRRWAAGLFPNSELISVSGSFHYPPKGFMGWHTNSNMEGWRVYASFATEDDKSFFRYAKGKVVYTEYEKKGWNFRAFQVKKNDLYWHCVYADADRYSFGFRFAL